MLWLLALTHSDLCETGLGEGGVKGGQPEGRGYASVRLVLWDGMGSYPPLL